MHPDAPARLASAFFHVATFFILTAGLVGASAVVRNAISARQTQTEISAQAPVVEWGP